MKDLKRLILTLVYGVAIITGLLWIMGTHVANYHEQQGKDNKEGNFK